jgi:hypothetical protein
MRLYYRLLMFDLAVMAPLTYGVWLHNLRKPVLLVVSIALLVANYVIAKKVVRQSETLFLKNIKWRSGLLWAWTLGPVSTGWLPLMFASLLVKTQFSGIVDMGLVAYGAFSCWSTVSRSEEWRINNSANSRPIDPSKIESYLVSSYRNREAINEVPATKTRPGWVWFICIWYTIGAVFSTLMLYRLFSGSLLLTPQAKASLAGATTFDYLQSIVQPLLWESAAVVLFLLRREATYLFWSLLGINVASVVYHHVLNYGIRSNTIRGGITTALIAVGANLVICVYCEHLKRKGTLT